MRILLTGAAGFVGLAITEALLAAGHEVAGFDRAPVPEAARAAFAALPGRLTAYAGDVRDPVALGAALRHSGAEAVILGAAITAGPARERSEPLPVVEVNVAGVAAALQAVAALEQRPGRVLLLSSNAVYGDGAPDGSPSDEAMTTPRPQNLYALTKWMAELTGLRLASAMGLGLHVARLGVCCGPWEYETGLRDTLSAPWQVLRAALAGEEVVLGRDSRRDWLYSRDMGEAVRALLEAPALAEARYNIGGGHLWPLSAWCALLAERLPGFRWRIAAPGEAPSVELHGLRDRPPMAIHRLSLLTPASWPRAPAVMMADWLDWHTRHGQKLGPH
ncbi:NAD(P)-dependent oxidoreductase [Roseomonas sp. GC11]|uniref:NAD-dependent epimerase/dehydratase family protein n=1 Tax=Roseomonas sp. GC11 TaxID=2950546 RepID=UPI00210EDB1E|nr:NAD(P)-dependent oxidoreductase [Roseomonas sp. GC11]MCQ4159668.1 NAD(P)-dependent oxidoreductase [Roseomonas sp. GC11]